MSVQINKARGEYPVKSFDNLRPVFIQTGACLNYLITDNEKFVVLYKLISVKNLKAPE